MKAESTIHLPRMIPEAMLTSTPRGQKSGMLKLLMPPQPPDERTIRELNALAARQPFCVVYRVRKHDML